MFWTGTRQDMKIEDNVQKRVKRRQLPHLPVLNAPGPRGDALQTRPMERDKFNTDTTFCILMRKTKRVGEHVSRSCSLVLDPKFTSFACRSDMAILSLTLMPDAVVRLHDALVCLGKFGESVSIDARRDKVQSSIWSAPKVVQQSLTILHRADDPDNTQPVKIVSCILRSGCGQLLQQVSLPTISAVQSAP